MKTLLKLICAGVAASLLPMSAALAQDIKERSLKFAFQNQADHPQGLGAKKFADLVAAKSGGKMTVKLFGGGTLGGDLQTVSALQGGTVEVTVLNAGLLSGIVKDFEVVDFPFLFNSGAEADKVMDGPFGKKLLDELPDKGLIGLAFWENGFRQITNNRRPIAKVEDIAGLKLRVIQSPIYLDTFQALGANALPMPFTELYTALEQRAVDGQENPVATILASKFYEVQKHLVMSRHIYSVWVLLLSKKTWDGFSADEKKAVTEAAREATLFERKTIREFGEKALGELKTKGVQVTELPAAEQAKMRDKLKPVVEKFSKELSPATATMMTTELEKLRAGKK